MQARDAALLARLRWIVGLRWLAAAGVISLSVFAVHVLAYDLPLLGLQVLGLVIVGHNIACRHWLHRIRSGPVADQRRGLDRCANAQIGFDLVALAVAVHFTGGVESPLSFFFVFHMIIASMILSRESAYGQATLVLCLYGAVALLEGRQVLPHYHLGLGADPGFYLSTEAWPRYAVLVAGLYVVVYLTSSIAGELRRREEQLASLTRELAEQAGACRAAYGDLQTTQHSQLEYMRRVAHELKSPLSAISMMLHAVTGSLGGTIPPKQSNMVARAADRAQAALELTEDLLTLSQLKEALPTDELAQVSIGHLVENIMAEEELRAEQSGVRISVQSEEAMPLIHGYRTELLILLRNLVSNAVKFSLPDGVVAIHAHSEGGEVVVQVSDQGIGIDEDELHRIFDEFYRTSASRKAGISGTGLGLPIAKSIVEHHSGAISVRSRLGQGTTFAVRLPVTWQGAGEEPGPPTGGH